MHDEQDNIAELYERFREAIGNSDAMYFDETELAAIFDYAGSNDDRYAQAEALFLGARLYPDSTLLSEKRALLYLESDDSINSVQAYLHDYNPDTPISDILRLHTEPPQDADRCRALNKILNRYDTLTEEEAMHLSRLACFLSQYPWLVRNIEKLCNKCTTTDHLLFAIFTEADEAGDCATMLKIAEEITEQEPFNAAGWISLLRAHARTYDLIAAKKGKDDPEAVRHAKEAANAFGYVKLLTIDSSSNILALGETVTSYAPFLTDDTIEFLSNAKAKDDDFSYTLVLMGLLLHRGNKSAAVSAVKKFLKQNPGNLMALRHLLYTNDADCSTYVRAYFAEVPPTKLDEYDEIVEQLHVQAAASALNDFMAVYGSLWDPTPIQTAIWIEALYTLGRYDEVIERFNSLSDYDSVLNAPLRIASLAVSVVGSYMKRHDNNGAIAFINATRPTIESMITEAPLPLRLTLHSILSFYDTVRRHPASEKFFWEYYNPFFLPK